MRISGLGAVLAVALAALTLTATTARADWLKAESERFIVYSEGSERSLREYVQKLETFDRVMRYRSGFPMNEAPPRKLPIYLVNSRSGLLRVHPSTPQNVVGTYFPTSEDIFAVAVRGENDEILLHEYVHHFMLGSMSAAYPGWFVEGFAEYYMTADIDGGKIQVGGYSENRAYWLFNGSWIPLEMLLRSRPAEITRSSYRETYYPVAWLLTHWFFSDPARLQQLSAYLTSVGNGGDLLDTQYLACGAGRLRQKAQIAARVGDILFDDELVPVIDRDLRIVAHADLGAGRHPAYVGIGKRQLTFPARDKIGQHRTVQFTPFPHSRYLRFQCCCPAGGALCFNFCAIGKVETGQIILNPLIGVLDPSGQLLTGEVALAAVHRLEPRAVHRHQFTPEQVEAAA